MRGMGELGEMGEMGGFAASGPAEDVYLHGHHDSVLRSHRWRTAENSAAYLLPHLRPGQRVLDAGCGPGTITADLAARVAPGEVVGLDRSAVVLEEARATADARGATNATFVVGDLYRLPYPDASFDVVHAHQVLQHLSGPASALRELVRVARPGGVVGVRDSDYGAMAWHPANPGLDRWRELYRTVARSLGAEPDAGRHLLSWALAAGLPRERLTSTAGTWCYSSEQERRWWGELWAQRCVSSDFAQQALATRMTSSDELEHLAASWRRWAQTPDGWFVVVHGEILVQVPGGDDEAPGGDDAATDGGEPAGRA